MSDKKGKGASGMNALKTAARLFVALILVTAVQAAALPTDTVTRNLNGVQQCLKTYTVAPDYPPEKLAQEPFELDGYSYVFSSMDKKERYFEDEKSHTETVTVKTSERELSAVISALPPVKDYDDGKYRGVLNLNASTIHTEAAGYETQSYAVSATREFENLDSNDMSYIPANMTKDGVTLSLQSVDWQAQESELVEDMLIPSSYKAVASYAGTGYRKAATGYVSTASYTGTVSCRLLKDVTYTVTYVGTPIEKPPEKLEEPSPQEPEEPLREETEKQPQENAEGVTTLENPEAASDTASPVDTPESAPEPSENEPPEAEEPESVTPPETTENPPEAETPATAEPSDTPETVVSDNPDKDEKTSERRFRLLCAGGGIVALIVIITVATAMERRRKQRASAYDEVDDYPYYNGYGEPPYNGDGAPPYEPEDANAPYDDGSPAPWETDAWEEDGATYPPDGAQFSADEMRYSADETGSADEPYDNAFPSFDAPDVSAADEADAYPEAEESPGDGYGNA